LEVVAVILVVVLVWPLGPLRTRDLTTEKCCGSGELNHELAASGLRPTEHIIPRIRDIAPKDEDANRVRRQQTT
jgi:hypothetical protein